MIEWKFPCEDPACTPAAHRPYAKARGKNWRPTISDLAGIDTDDGLDGAAFKAAQIASEFALTHGIKQLAEGVPFDEVLLKSSRVHAARWSTDMHMGSHCHEAAEAFAIDKDYDLPENLFSDDEDRLFEFVSGLRKWWDAREPIVLASEFIVSRGDPRYVGTGDLIAAIDGEPVGIDFKTHREYKDDRSPKFAKWTKQLTMLGLATHIEHYHGTQKIATIPWLNSGLPRPRRWVILCLESDGTWREFETHVDPEDTERIVRPLVDVRLWKPQMEQVKK